MENWMDAVNPLDIAVVAAVLLFMFLAWRRGLIKSLFGLVSFFASIILANALYPVIGRFLREYDPFYEWLKTTILNTVGIPEIAADTSRAAQNYVISNLNLPDFLIFSMLENNNPEAHNILNVTGLTDYIGGFLANIVINIISLLLAFILIFIGMKILGSMLDVVSKLPIINMFNKIGGLIIGFFQGTLLIWLIFTGVFLFLSRPLFADFLELMEASRIAVIFYENNFIMRMVLQVRP